MMDNGFVLITNNQSKYLYLLDIAIDSILTFTDKKLEIHGINFDYVPINKRILSKRINLKTESFDSICSAKYIAILNSQFSHGIYLDSDMIVTKDINNLFSPIYKIESMPLLPLHPTDEQSFNELMRFFNIKRKTQPYLHADLILFNGSCKHFFENCLKMCNRAIYSGVSLYAGDESVINILFWIYGAKKHFLPLCDPNYRCFEKKMGMDMSLLEDISRYVFYTCHGCKNVERARKILSEIKNRNGIA